MLAGKLRHRVQLAQPADSQDGYGQVIRDYAAYATVWAMLEPLQGRELEHARQVSAETTIRVRIRYRAGVIDEHRVLFGDRIFEITSVINPEEKNIELVLMCKEIS